MAKISGTVVPALVALLSLALVLCDGLPATMTLERAFPMSQDVELSQVIARDMARHGRMLQSTTNGVVDFPVDGTYNPFIVGYVTMINYALP